LEEKKKLYEEKKRNTLVKKQSLTEELETLREKIATQHALAVQVTKNIQHKEKLEEVQALQSAISKMELELGSLVGESTDFNMEDKQQMVKQLHSWLNTSIGERKVMKRQQEELAKDLAKDVYRDIDKKCAKLLVEEKVCGCPLSIRTN